MDTETARIEVAESLGVVTSDRDPETVISEGRLLSENAIPIGPTVGARYQTRFNDGIRAQKKMHDDWKKAIKEFTATGAYDGDTLARAAPKENIIRTTVETLVDFSYMRNPSVELTSQDDAGQDVANLLGSALPVLMNKKSNLGLNLRPKMLKQIIYAHFTNFGVLKLNFQPKKGSQEQALETLEAVQKLIKEEKNEDAANRYYELLDILQRELENRRAFGMSVSVVNPFNIIADPDCTETDLSNGNWLMERDQMDEDYIRAEYMKMDEETQTLVYRYDESVGYEQEKQDKQVDAAATAETVLREIMPDLEDAQADLKMKNKQPVVWVYDRVTKLVILYLEGRWETPLWVYKDEMKLSRFFPHFVLSFSSPLNSITQRGEVSHYIDFQEEINSINQQASSARNAAFNLFLYDVGSVDKKEVDKVLKELTKSSTEMRAIGVKLKDKDKGVDSMLVPFKVPSLQIMEMFDKTGLKEAIKAASRIGDAMRGQQFKTNTNTTAVNTYKEQAQTRLEGLTDKIEASAEDLIWAVCELVVSQFTAEEMQMLVSAKAAEQFQQMSVTDFNLQYALQIAAGSTEKPTTEKKKQEAVGIIQMLGQFGTAAPGTVLSIVSRLLRSAFSRDLVTDDDLARLHEESSAAMQKGVSTAGPTPPGQPEQPKQATPPKQPAQ